jgi:hypothetical protein
VSHVQKRTKQGLAKPADACRRLSTLRRRLVGDDAPVGAAGRFVTGRATAASNTRAGWGVDFDEAAMGALPVCKRSNG